MHITGKKKIILSVFLASFAGFLHALAFDPFDALAISQYSFIFSFIGISLWLWLIVKSTTKQALILGYFFGLSSFGWGINWIHISLSSFGNASVFFAILSNVLVIAYLAIYWLLSGYLITRFSSSRNLRLLIAPFIILLLEWMRSWFILGFPWLSIGYAWIDSPLAQIAEHGGILLVGFLAIVPSIIILMYKRLICKVAITATYVTIIILLSFSPNISSKATLDVALVQGNTPVITQYTEPYMSNTIKEYLTLNEQLIASGESVDLLIWPESSIPYYLNHFADGMESIHHQQQRMPFTFISGVPFYDEKTEKTYNASILQQPDKTQAIYKKVSLVPFGEYIPFRTLFTFFKSFVQIPLSDFQSGEIQQKPFIIKNTKATMSMCFDIIFGNSIRLNAQGTELLINISNESWFKQSKAQYQHLNMARMRAIENRKPIIRSTSTGLTSHILADGSIKKAIPPYQKGILTDKVKTNNYLSFYNQYGDKPWVILMIIFILLLLASNIYLIKKRNH